MFGYNNFTIKQMNAAFAGIIARVVSVVVVVGAPVRVVVASVTAKA